MPRIEIKETLAAPRERVFEAFARAASIEQWLAPSDDFRTVVREFDFRPGGTYRIEFHSPEGDTNILTGTYREIVPPERIVFSWRWMQDAEFSDVHTQVTVLLNESADGAETSLCLIHENLPQGKMTERHIRGWNGALERLTRLF